MQNVALRSLPMILGACGCLAGLLCSSPPVAAADLFLYLDSIPGESEDRSHHAEIEVLSWSWAVSSVGESEAGAMARRHVQFRALQIAKWIDKASPLLMKRLWDGRVLREARLTVRKPGRSESEFCLIELQDLIVTSYATTNSSRDAHLKEDVSFSFSQVDITYIQVDPDGNEEGRALFFWDLVANEGGGSVSASSSDHDGDGNPNSYDPDDDDDGIPDYYEVLHGLQPFLNDAGLDKDRDGLTNLEEYLIGTSASDPDSVLKATLHYTNGEPAATLSWPCVANIPYRILFSPSLKAPLLPLRDAQSPVDGTLTETVPASTMTGFFRIQALVP